MLYLSEPYFNAGSRATAKSVRSAIKVSAKRWKLSGERKHEKGLKELHETKRQSEGGGFQGSYYVSFLASFVF